MIFETSMSIRKTICAIVALLLSAPAARAQYQQVDDIACGLGCPRSRAKRDITDLSDGVHNFKTMKLKKRKIKYAAIFFICWFALLVILVDGILKFQTLVDWFGSYALVEMTLLLLVILPTLAVYRYIND